MNGKYGNCLNLIFMLNIKLTFPYLNWDLKRQSPKSSSVWGDYIFHINEEIEECDFWFVFNGLLKPSENTRCNQKNVVLLTAEPSSVENYNNKFIKQFSHVITCQREIKHAGKTYHHQGQPYFVGANYFNSEYVSFTKGYDELTRKTAIEKKKSISLITSNKSFTDGHAQRLNFCRKLKEYFGNQIDLFGRGINDFQDKWDVLSDYKYSIAIENSSQEDYFTEKINDCFLAHTFPIYYGCSNLEKYYNPKSYQIINIHDFDESRRTIERLLNDEHHYSEALSYILDSKSRYLNQYNIFPLIVSFIENNLNPNLPKKQVSLRQNSGMTLSNIKNSINFLKPLISKNAKKNN